MTTRGIFHFSTLHEVEISTSRACSERGTFRSGTALGDFAADDAGLGFERGALVFASLIALVAALHFFTKLSDSVLFWAAYILTRPLGATLGDTLTKPTTNGGLNLSRITSSLVIAVVMIVMIALSSRRLGRSVNPSDGARV